MQKKILVLGVGNVLLTDDGLGPRIIKELADSYTNPNVTFLDGGTLGLDLLPYVEGYDCLLIIDALDLGEKPGSIFCWEGKTLNGVSEQVSFHQIGVKELLHIINLLDMDIEIVIMGIQADELSWGMEVSAAVEEAIPRLKKEIVNRLDKLCK